MLLLLFSLSVACKLVSLYAVLIFCVCVNTINQLIFMAIHFCVFVFIEILPAINFLGLQIWTMQEHRTVCICLNGHVCGDLLFTNFYFSQKYIACKTKFVYGNMFSLGSRVTNFSRIRVITVS